MSSHIFKDKGRCWTYRERIPSDLVTSYDNRHDIRCSLKTHDKAFAKRLAMTIALQVASEFDAKRQEIVLASPFAKSSNPIDSPTMRRLSDISEIERGGEIACSEGGVMVTYFPNYQNGDNEAKLF